MKRVLHSTQLMAKRVTTLLGLDLPYRVGEGVVESRALMSAMLEIAELTWRLVSRALGRCRQSISISSTHIVTVGAQQMLLLRRGAPTGESGFASSVLRGLDYFSAMPQVGLELRKCTERNSIKRLGN